MVVERRIGEHVLREEEDGILVITFRGDLSVAEMRAIVEEHDARLVRDGDLYVVSDLRLLGALERGARHVLGNRSKELPGYCSAYMAPHFKMRLVMDLLMKAVNLMMASKVLHRFFDREEDALVWLRETREQKRARAA
jgi:hypothetical protein